MKKRRGNTSKGNRKRGLKRALEEDKNSQTSVKKSSKKPCEITDKDQPSNLDAENLKRFALKECVVKLVQLDLQAFCESVRAKHVDVNIELKKKDRTKPEKQTNKGKIVTERPPQEQRTRRGRVNKNQIVAANNDQSAEEKRTKTKPKASGKKNNAIQEGTNPVLQILVRNGNAVKTGRKRPLRGKANKTGCKDDKNKDTELTIIEEGSNNETSKAAGKTDAQATVTKQDLTVQETALPICIDTDTNNNDEQDITKGEVQNSSNESNIKNIPEMETEELNLKLEIDENDSITPDICLRPAEQFTIKNIPDNEIKELNLKVKIVENDAENPDSQRKRSDRLCIGEGRKPEEEIRSTQQTSMNNSDQREIQLAAISSTSQLVKKQPKQGGKWKKEEDPNAQGKTSSESQPNHAGKRKEANEQSKTNRRGKRMIKEDPIEQGKTSLVSHPNQGGKRIRKEDPIAQCKTTSVLQETKKAGAWPKSVGQKTCTKTSSVSQETPKAGAGPERVGRNTYTVLEAVVLLDRLAYIPSYYASKKNELDP